MATKRILSIKLSDLTLDPQNARKHGEKDIAAIAASLKQFGQQSPIVVKKEQIDGKQSWVVIKGNGTLMAALSLEWDKIDCIETMLTGDQLKAYAIADNRTAELSEWDDQRLLEQLQSFDDQELADATGFDAFELAELLAKYDTSGFEPVDEDTQGKLDELKPKLVVCPHCKAEFDSRG